MIGCRIILHGDLPDLTGGRGTIDRRQPAPTTAGDLLESLGIPHGEIGAVLIAGRPATLASPIAGEALLEAWPTLPLPLPLDDPRFICDLHLGKLARLLRFCGFDTIWDRAAGEPAIARLAAGEGRVILSRHRALLKRRAVTRSLLVRSDQADRQLVEVLRRYRLAGRITRPGRCPACNGRLAATPKSAVPVPIPPRTAAWLDDYWLCRDCGQLYWEGTHAERLRLRLAQAIAEAVQAPAPDITDDGRPRSADT